VLVFCEERRLSSWAGRRRGSVEPVVLFSSHYICPLLLENRLVTFARGVQQAGALGFISSLLFRPLKAAVEI
jgi:hypothetical protein